MSLETNQEKSMLINESYDQNKICLITPPSPFLLDERVFMHIGILKVASSLESGPDRLLAQATTRGWLRSRDNRTVDVARRIVLAGGTGGWRDSNAQAQLR